MNRRKKSFFPLLLVIIAVAALNVFAIHYIKSTEHPEPTDTTPAVPSVSDSSAVEISFLGAGMDAEGCSLNRGTAAPVELGAGAVDIYCKDKYQMVPLSGSQLVWSTSDESIATVDEKGRISTHAAGQAVVTATDPDGNSDSCTVNVIKVVYVTIDDVPNDYTMQILDILDEHNIRATFFFNAEESKAEYYREIYRRGHAFAMHGYRHHTYYKSTDSFLYNMENCRDFLVETTGCAPDYVENVVRFPTGSKGSKCYRPILTQIQERGYSAFDWTTEFHECGNSTAEGCFKYFKRHLTHDRDVFLFHSMRRSLEALPDAIDYIIEQGYTFAPITEYTAQYNAYNKYVNE